ncbi:kinase-like domain-containing protein [Suillus spraguei]|nr:kinase-like domain-containing protein [Suillus spraguei]
MMHTGALINIANVPLASYSFGPFRVWRVLGEGGSATAMGAQDVVSNRLLCLKVFRKDRLKYRLTEEVLLNELEVYKRLALSMQCPATRFLMGLEMSFQTRDQICFVMDLMASDLHAYMMYRSTYCSYHASRWTAQIALGINALHEIGIIHRDIKSENILIDVRQNVRIADFGLSFLNQGPLERRQGYTAGVVGTTYFMAPEILYNRTNPGSMMYGAPVDWWALGCVVYELVSNNHQSLFGTEDNILFYISWCGNSGRRARQFPAFERFPEHVVDLVSGLLEPIPAFRYGFHEVANHKSFLLAPGMSEFSDAYSRALARQELHDSLPDLRYEREIETAEVWFPLPSLECVRVPNVDWIKPAFFR